MTFEDPTIKYVRNLIEELRSVNTKLSNYIDNMSKTMNYDYSLNKTKQKFYMRQYALYGTSQPNAPWIQSVELFVRAMSVVYNLTENEKSDLLDKCVSKLDPRHATIKSARRFQKEYESLRNTTANHTTQPGNLLLAIRLAQHFKNQLKWETVF